uniref:Uncharacterized protein n=1 Tax=Cacopsylla melanoneura TaxID=428564 RepID=A0A8D8R7N6_9HEMI
MSYFQCTYTLRVFILYSLSHVSIDHRGDLISHKDMYSKSIEMKRQIFKTENLDTRICYRKKTRVSSVQLLVRYRFVFLFFPGQLFWVLKSAKRMSLFFRSSTDLKT